MYEHCRLYGRPRQEISRFFIVESSALDAHRRGFVNRGPRHCPADKSPPSAVEESSDIESTSASRCLAKLTFQNCVGLTEPQTVFIPGLKNYKAHMASRA